MKGVRISAPDHRKACSAVSRWSRQAAALLDNVDAQTLPWRHAETDDLCAPSGALGARRDRDRARGYRDLGGAPSQARRRCAGCRGRTDNPWRYPGYAEVVRHLGLARHHLLAPIAEPLTSLGLLSCVWAFPVRNRRSGAPMVGYVAVAWPPLACHGRLPQGRCRARLRRRSPSGSVFRGLPGVPRSRRPFVPGSCPLGQRELAGSLLMRRENETNPAAAAATNNRGRGARRGGNRRAQRPALPEEGRR
jgi:hypothetical protein